MKIIKLHNGNGRISVILSIEGIDFWHYEYKADESFFNSTKLQKEPKHELGIIANLHKDVHFWNIKLANMGDSVKNVLVKIEWYDDQDLIASWIPLEATVNGRVPVKANSGIELYDSALFYLNQ